METKALINMKHVNWILLLITVSGLLYSFITHQVPTSLAFNASPQATLGLLSSLFVITLIVERAVEVVMLVFRDQRADSYVEDANSAEQSLKAFAQNLGLGDKAALEVAFSKAQKRLLQYRAETKEIAQILSFTFGIIISLAGIRILDQLLQNPSSAGRLFGFFDIVITGLVIAGGSEGIHQVANVFTDFMGSLSARASQIQKQAP